MLGQHLVWNELIFKIHGDLWNSTICHSTAARTDLTISRLLFYLLGNCWINKQISWKTFKRQTYRQVKLHRAALRKYIDSDWEEEHLETGNKKTSAVRRENKWWRASWFVIYSKYCYRDQGARRGEARHLARLEEIKNAYKISLCKAWRHVREDKIGKDLKEHRQAVMADIKQRVLASSNDITWS